VIAYITLTSASYTRRTACCVTSSTSSARFNFAESGIERVARSVDRTLSVGAARSVYEGRRAPRVDEEDEGRRRGRVSGDRARGHKLTQ
jgi:hypothetical protein